jgi:hypothetical protein
VCESFTPPEEIRRQSEIFEPRASLDTTPVTVKVVDVTYRIPRNYLIVLEPAIPTLRVTYPGFKPLSEGTKDCFDPKWRMQHSECIVIEFLLLGSRGPGPEGRAYTNAERFENFKRNSRSIRFRSGPFGYDIFEEGPEDARSEHYRKTEGDIFFTAYFQGTRIEQEAEFAAICSALTT